MRPIPDASPLRGGDVLHHPAFGFAVVERADPTRPEGIVLRWEQQGGSHPARIGAAHLGAAYRLCVAGGFFAQSVLDPEGLRAALSRAPADTLVRLIHELGEPQVEEDLSDWLLQRGLFARARLGAWWDGVRPVLDADPRFVREGLSWGLAAGVEPPPEDARPLPAPGSLPAREAFVFAERLAFALARAHERGETLVREVDAVRQGPAGVVLRTMARSDAAAQADDVRTAMVEVLEQVAGPLPMPQDLGQGELLAMIGACAPDLPVELLGVALDALAREPALRPPHGFALLERVVAARAAHELRARVGWMRRATIAAGFDTHVGIGKSLIHQANQDALVAVGEHDAALVAVCDGISTSNAGTGDLASNLTGRGLRAHWAEHGGAVRDADPERVHAFLQDALARANALVCDGARRIAGADLPRSVPMGSTCVAAVTRGNRVHLAALGDSRAYLVGRHGVSILTSDHDVAAEHLLDTLARREPFAMPDHPWSLTRFLGHFDDDFRPLALPPWTRTVDLLPGEWLVLATDGLSDYAADEEAGVARLLRETVESVRGTPVQAATMKVARALVNAANEGGGGDNVTVLVLTLDALGAPGPDEETVG
jgi:serine/threonine protein phosphatase PrpC